MKSDLSMLILILRLKRHFRAAVLVCAALAVLPSNLRSYSLTGASAVPTILLDDVSEEAGVGLVPTSEMTKTNPMAIAAVRADVNRALFGASVTTALVIFHNYVIGAAFLATSVRSRG
jgi:hypothetical protein